MKKLFASLMLGFGAALGVFVALAMPPGGWGVAVGVGLGLLGCLPLLLIMMLLIGRGQTDSRRLVYEEAPAPVIVIQQPGLYDPFPDYPQRQGQGRGFLPGTDYYAYPVEPEYDRYMSQAAIPAYNRLPAARRPQPEYQPEMLAYNRQDFYPDGYAEHTEEDPYYYAAPPLEPPGYPAYCGPRQAHSPVYNLAADDPDRFYPAPNRVQGRLPSRYDEAVEAEYRTIGDN